MKELVFIENDRVLTDSLIVSETFNKRHNNVKRDISELGCSPEFNALNFEHINYQDSRGRTQEKVLITQDGFVFLVMGYTGKEASKFKEEYIGAFNRMKDELSKPKVLSEKEQLIASMKLTLETTKELTAVKQDVDELKLAVNDRMTLDYGQQQVLLRSKNKRVEKFWKQQPDVSLVATKKMVHASAWRDLKDAFNVASYRDIRQSDFQEALNYINAWRPRTSWLEMNA